MKNVVITGSTKGIGLGLAKEFLKKESTVFISGRNKERLDHELFELKKTLVKKMLVVITVMFLNILK